eukprot:scaffold141_cov410-Prasinococcus_capsulatus_cf.AAC.10
MQDSYLTLKDDVCERGRSCCSLNSFPCDLNDLKIYQSIAIAAISGHGWQLVHALKGHAALHGTTPNQADNERNSSLAKASTLRPVQREQRHRQKLLSGQTEAHISRRAGSAVASTL